MRLPPFGIDPLKDWYWLRVGHLQPVQIKRYGPEGIADRVDDVPRGRVTSMRALGDKALAPHW